MNIAMLWFDNDPSTGFVSKLKRAAEYFKKNYGRDCNLILVHPSLMIGSGDNEIKDLPFLVRPWRYMLPHQFWVRIEEGRLPNNVAINDVTNDT